MSRINVIAVLIVSVLFSCQNNVGKGTVVSVDTLKNKVQLPIPVSARKKIDFTKLYSTWIPVSMHYHDTTDILLPIGKDLEIMFKNKGDTGIQSFLPDIDEYKNYYEEHVTFRKNGQWTDVEDDLGSSGTFTVDTIKNLLTPSEFPFSRHPVVDTFISFKIGILYLDENYLLFDWYYGKEKLIYFYINENYIVKTKKWHFQGGG